MKFPENFMWGAASAAYQIEGGYRDDGKGENIWDVFSRIKGNVMHMETGDVACDHYHRYREDVQIMKNMGVKFYRFSINWTRVIPNGTGKVNKAGLKFYSDLVDELIANGITPMVTLFHWDYPYELHKKGGWLNSESSDWFEEYAKVVVDALSDRVSYWMTINEPQVFIGCGYAIAACAPYEKHSNRELALMSHNVLLAHGKAVRVIRNNAKLTPTIGFAYATPCVTPLSDSADAIEDARARSMDFTLSGFAFELTWWADPIFFGKYPEKAIKLLGDDMPQFTDEDMEIISSPVDFYGVNLYDSKADKMALPYSENSYIGIARTFMGWPVTPEVLYWTPKFIYERYKKPVIICENGMAGHDWVHLDGRVHDMHRIDYVKRYLRELAKACDEGVDVRGYMYWSILDNYEWSEGYDKRFGLVHVDYVTQKRTVKNSGYWYKSVIESNGDVIFDDSTDVEYR